MPWVAVSKDKKGFVLDPPGRPFVLWGFNYDHDDKGRLIEDYWDEEWPTLEAHFGQMKKLGANAVRIHLQLGKFMDGPDKANEKALTRLDKLLRLAEKERLYLDLTGLGCYHKRDVPGWYDNLSEDQLVALSDGNVEFGNTTTVRNTNRRRRCLNLKSRSLLTPASFSISSHSRRSSGGMKRRLNG